MSLVLFEAVPSGTIEAIFDEENHPWFKRADLGRYLGIVSIKDSFKNFPVEYLHTREDITWEGATIPRSGQLGGGKNLHDMFVNLDGAVEIAVRSKKDKATELAIWLAKKGVERSQVSSQVHLNLRQLLLVET